MRTIRYDPQYESDAAEIEPYAPQFDTIAFAVEWVTARDPSQGRRIGSTGIWAMTSEPYVNRQEEVVVLTIFYRFDDISVTMISVMEEPFG